MASDIIRAAVPSDADELCRLNRAFNGSDTATAGHIRAQLHDSGFEHCIVCEHDGTLIGFICGICFHSLCYRAPSAQITELFVQEDARRRGIASALLQAMIVHLRSIGASEIMLLTGGDNLPAQRLYERNGFAAEDERCYFYNP